MEQPLSLSRGAQLLPVNLTDNSVSTLYGAIEQRIHAGNTGPLVIVEDRQDTVAQVARRVEDAPNLSDVILATSGSSSSRPHLVGLSWKALESSASATNTYLGNHRWLLPLPIHHVAGLQILVRSVLNGSYPLVAERTSKVPELIESSSSSLLTSLVPTQLLQLLGTNLDACRSILVGGARLDPQLRARAGNLPLVTTYGMTETAGGCVYDGIPLPGVKVLLENQHILLGGPTIMDGYLDESSPFTAVEGTRYLTTSDTGSWRDGKLSVEGRLDQVIITGGENVSPAAVADSIGELHPNLTVTVLGIPSEKWGETVCAVLTGTTGSARQLGPSVRQAVKATLGPRAAPRLVVALPALPLLGNGKVDLRGLRQQVKDLSDPDTIWSVDQ